MISISTVVVGILQKRKVPESASTLIASITKVKVNDMQGITVLIIERGSKEYAQLEFEV